MLCHFKTSFHEVKNVKIVVHGQGRGVTNRPMQKISNAHNAHLYTVYI